MESKRVELTSRHPRRIVLIGLSGSGKSAVARALATRLGWRMADSDAMIEAEERRTVPEIFARDGEECFRALERIMTERVTAWEDVVISTGGGAPLSEANRECLWRDAFVVRLEARAETLLGRVASGSRPLLGGADPLQRLRSLAAERAPVYELADWTIATDDLTPDDVASELERAFRRFGAQKVTRRGRAIHPTVARPPAPDLDVADVVHTPSGSYPIVVGTGVLSSLGDRMRRLGISGRVHVISDANVAPLHADAALAALSAADYDARLLEITPGEDHKTLAAAEQVFDWLISDRAERREAVVALGGGVVTDLAGFVAATILRGVPLVHVPTSLLGAVDAAIGGKVAVDHRLGKNLVGAFYQPRLVVIDADLLRTLPPRELASGWAEVIKHGLIADPGLVAFMEERSESIRALETDSLLPVLRRSVQIKAKVVSADERESDLRTTLNYGHTIGHALEAATEYRGPLHGEAVAVGMAGAGAIGHRLGLLSAAELERQNRLIAAYGLPLAWPGASVERILNAMTLDKKTTGATIRWVMLDGIGRTVGRSDIAPGLVHEIVGSLMREPNQSLKFA
jgi:shikimate kinase / 3-dehydroquinate synthase